MPLLAVALHVVVVLGSLGTPVDSGRGVSAVVAVFFVILGNSMGKLKHNWFVGIRTPWTLASEEVWNRTHRLAAPIWVTGGLVQLVGAFLPGTAGAALFATSLAAMILAPIGYSFVLFRKLSSSGSA